MTKLESLTLMKKTNCISVVENIYFPQDENPESIVLHITEQNNSTSPLRHFIQQYSLKEDSYIPVRIFKSDKPPNQPVKYKEWKICSEWGDNPMQSYGAILAIGSCRRPLMPAPLLPYLLTVYCQVGLVF